MTDGLNQQPTEHVIDASGLYFADIRFLRETVMSTFDITGPIDGFGELLRWAITILEYEVAIARMRGKYKVIENRLTLSAAIDRAEHLRWIYGMYYD